MNLFIGIYSIFLFALIYIINKICTVVMNKISKLNDRKQILLDYRKVYNDKIKEYNNIFPEIKNLNNKINEDKKYILKLKDEYNNIRKKCKNMGNNLHSTVIKLFDDYRNNILPN